MTDFSTIAQGPDSTLSSDQSLLPVHPPHDTCSSSAVLHRTLHSAPLQMVSTNKKELSFSNGQTILDSTCGAGVACIGYNNKRVQQAMIDQINKFCYCNSMFFGHPIGEELATELVQGTGNLMAKAFVVCSGEHRYQVSASKDIDFLQAPKQWKRL
jgi:adenosylmethionine-8-amino-7-oxononanoate aminotransferase